jgi:hypothetical protein
MVDVAGCVICPYPSSQNCQEWTAKDKKAGVENLSKPILILSESLTVNLTYNPYCHKNYQVT